MIRFASVLVLTLAAGGVGIGAASAASFDCAKATTPFERAICGDADLSKADVRLATTYATAVGGLSEVALGEMRAGQREWLAYAQRACTGDAKPMATGSYDERGLSCLAEIFNSRSSVLEQSRMISGLRFYPVSRYEALQDPYEADDPDSWYPVARHELAYVQLDLDEGFAYAFSDMTREDALIMSSVFADGAGPNASEDDDGSSSDTQNSLFVEEVAGDNRITLKSSTYWYGHGAAHGNWGVSYRHYLIEQGRFMEARDMFSAEGWEKALLDLTVAAAEAQHGDNLMLDDATYIADAVARPERWILSDPYDLIIQFQPYEISAYAYGAPTVRVAWDALEPYLNENASALQYGF